MSKKSKGGAARCGGKGGATVLLPRPCSSLDHQPAGHSTATLHNTRANDRLHISHAACHSWCGLHELSSTLPPCSMHSLKCTRRRFSNGKRSSSSAMRTATRLSRSRQVLPEDLVHS